MYYRFRYDKDNYEDMTYKEVRRQLKIQDAFLITIIEDENKKRSRSKLVKDLDTIFSRYIRMRDSNKFGIVTCPLCGNSMPRKEAQNMHFIKRSVYLFRRSESNCFAGDYRCNVILKWNYIEYTRFMQNKFGISAVDEMISLSKTIHKISTPEIEEKIQYYKLAVIELEKHIEIKQ